jgi:putative phosphoribosyl transferase
MNTGVHGVSDRAVEIRVGPSGVIHGDMVVPHRSGGLVAFAHGSGSSRQSPRNRRVADALHGRGLATLLLDLLTEGEEAIDHQTAQLRFDIDLLAERLGIAIGFIEDDRTTAGLPVGLFGASTGAAAALVAAAHRPERISAVVSRGGRADLAGAALRSVVAPTLLIVGGRDEHVVDLNHQAAKQLRCPHELVILPGATHLFEEAGALAEVARLAGDWFSTYLLDAAGEKRGPDG